jgi:hypothetical protein
MLRDKYDTGLRSRHAVFNFGDKESVERSEYNSKTNYRIHCGRRDYKEQAANIS